MIPVKINDVLIQMPDEYRFLIPLLEKVAAKSEADAKSELLSDLQLGQDFVRTARVTATLAEIIAGKVIVPAVTGKKIRVLHWSIRCAGNAAGATGVKLLDDNDTPVEVTAVVTAGLGTGVHVLPWTATHVTNGAGYRADLTTAKNLLLKSYGNELTGTTSMIATVEYVYV